MNARSLVVAIAALGVSSLSLAQEPNFGDLGVSETTTYHRSSTVRPSEIDTEAFDATCTQAEELLASCKAHFRAIYLHAERIFREGGGNVALGHWNESRFQASKKESADLRAKASRLKGLVNRLGSFFETLSLDDRQNYERLLERHAKVVRLLTEYDVLMTWATSYNLDYDTILPFDEKDAWVLKRSDFPAVELPTLPLIQITETLSDTQRREVEGRDGTPLVHEEQVLSSSRTTLRKAVDPGQVTELFDRARLVADEAETYRSRIVAMADDSTGRMLAFSCKLESFEKEIKPLAVDFALTMLRYKGLRNAIFALLEGSDLYEGNMNLRASWEELAARFQDLANWGDRHDVQWDRALQRERRFFLFFCSNFSGSFLFGGVTPTGLARRSSQMEALIPLTDSISVDDAFRIVKSVSGATRRRDMCYRVIPQTRGLTAQSLSNLVTWIGNEIYEEAVITFGLKYLNR